MPAVVLLLEAEVTGAEIDAALADLERRAEQRARLSRHLELCPVCNGNAHRRCFEMCEEATRMLRAAIAAGAGLRGDAPAG